MNRSDEPLFDARIAEWLEEDPHRAPDQTLEVVLAAFPSLKQRGAWRAPWRFTMPTLSKALAVGVSALIIVIGGAWLLGSRGPSVGNSTQSPTAEATETAPPPPSQSQNAGSSGPEMTNHVSPRYGYAVDVPSAYQFVPATEDWPIGEPLGPETEWTDRFRAGTNFMGIASQPLPEGTSTDDWLDAYARSVESRECGAPASEWTEVTFRDIPGRTLSFDCGGAPGREYAWTIGDRGWVMTGEASVVEMALQTLRIP
jgi:hypothetical protein